MRHWLSELTLNQRLAGLAFILGLAAVAATPTRQGRVFLRPQDLALIVQHDADHMPARVLADRLVKGQADVRLIDVRDAVSFAAFHIPTAENMPLAVLASASLPRNEKILLYGDDGVHAAQAWFLLKAQGYPGVYTLRGGLAEWQAEVVAPVLPAPATAEQRHQNEERAAVAAYFGGTPRTANATTGIALTAAPAPPAVNTAVPGAAAVKPPAPMLTMPKPPAGKAAVKKKEGC